jgi:seryl-tRNA synthetase
MLDIIFIKENKGRVEKSLKDRGLEGVVDIDKLLQTYGAYLDALRLVETKRGSRNTLSEDISKVTGDKKEKLVGEATKLKEDLRELEKTLSGLEGDYKEMLSKVPNIFCEDTPVGEDASGNEVLRKWGEIKKFDFKPRDHIELGKMLDIIDLDKAGEVSGSRFYYLKNEAVILEFSIIRLVLDTLSNKEFLEKLGHDHEVSSKPFVPVLPPVFVRDEVMKKMDRFDPIEERYHLERDNLVLVGSAEHSLGPIHMGETLEKEELPKRYVGFSTSFRREAGTYGKDDKGIFRTHQFDKLEIESFTTPENGRKEQDLIISVQEHLLQELELPYQVVSLCTGDMGKPDFRQIDMETWVPSQEKYRETHTSDYMTDYQSRRLGTFYKNKEGVRELVHMNDATAFAIGRILIMILENHQQKDGSVNIPKALRKYTGFEKITPK